LHLESLSGVREVDLEPNYMSLTKVQIASKAAEISKANKNSNDAFIRSLMKERSDLAGLPFLLGKDCALEPEASRGLAATSRMVRGTLAEAMAPGRRQRNPQSAGQSVDDTQRSEAAAAAGFWSSAKEWYGTPEWMIPVYHQILTGEGTEYRLGLVKNLSEVKNARATATLINRALFDLDPEVRQVALNALSTRPAGEYAVELKKGLRYPWLPVVQNAAQSIVTLNRAEMVPDLVNLLDEPDPRAPFTIQGEDGEEKTMVRELVRINHHRNCMLCHAAVDTNRDSIDRSVPVGPAPSPGDPLPPPSMNMEYYSLRPGITIVRADITYLRQDFSLNQVVKDPGKWPAMQRFDFLVRTRELTPAEAAAEQPKGHVDVEYRQAINFALRALTGIDAPPSAQEWRKALKPPGKPAAR
jgi:HEAT repeat protein